MSNRKIWMSVNPGKPKASLTKWDKDKVENLCQPIVEEFKKQCVKDDPDKRFNYLVDVYTKWRGNYLYFCEKFKSESPDRIADEFESKFVRLECIGKDKFNFSYFRHTGRWSLVATDLTLNDCLEMMQGNPNFQPVS
ncbi:MAG: hypothetical protein IH948_07555 [Bacteroidetes bacterium]|nr:hypothetical protein [Bacteroidota bacterium]